MNFKVFLSVAVLAAGFTSRAAEVMQERWVLENASLARVLSVKNGKLQTTEIINKLSGVSIKPASAPEFHLRLSQGTDRPQTAFTLTSSDFQVVQAERAKNTVTFALTNETHELGVRVVYELAPADFFMRKRLAIVGAKTVTLERVDVEALELKDAYQPYTNREITASAPGRWNPGLGQPLYTSGSATFWGVEFPAADNQVRNGSLYAGYLLGRQLQPGKPYESYAAVMGVANDPAFVADAFLDYINRIRVRPLRLQIQYNSWFDYGKNVSKEKFSASVEKINKELVKARGNRPFSAYVIDDGWENAQVDWSDKVWKVNEKFDPDFASSLRAVRDANSRLGLWLSPGCLFGAHPEVAKMREQGFEALDDWMSMAGPRYMQALEDRLEELTRQGVTFYKLDGLFGHLNLRNFELHGEKYDLPTMPQLGVGDFKAGDPRLNDPKYDELKIYYLTAGTERLMQIFEKIGKINPEVYIVISNGAYLSPWWLMSVDAVWMINAGDAAGGSTRNEQLVYRDDAYYEIWHKQNTQFPLCAVFNHEPKKTASDESPEIFRKYLFMSLSRGTGLIELYIKPSVLQSNDWDVLSQGLHWSAGVFPTFSRVRMHGGKPKAGEVYGYTGWNERQGYISIHNPSDKPQTYVVKLDRSFGVLPNSGPFVLSSPLGSDSLNGLPKVCKFGESLSFELSPREIRVINFESRSP